MFFHVKGRGKSRLRGAARGSQRSTRDGTTKGKQVIVSNKKGSARIGNHQQTENITQGPSWPHYHTRYLARFSQAGTSCYIK